MDSKERANRFYLARVEFNQHGEETKTKVYKETGIPASAIVDYENPESARTLNVKNVQKLADHYGVNAAWLLGQSESWSLDSDIRQISESTGLSPDAIWALQKLTKDVKRRSFVNAFLASEEFSHMVLMFHGMQTLTNTESNNIVEYSALMNRFDGESTLEFNERDIQDIRLWKTSRDLENLIKRITENNSN